MIRTSATAQEVGIEVGDFFAASWGYDQTNIDYWQVVGITPSGKSVKVRRCETVDAGTSTSPYEDVVMPGDQMGPVETKRLKVWWTDPGTSQPWRVIEGYWTATFKSTSYATAIWQGTGIFPTARQTAAGYGH